ncbi:hypothetical protein ACS127_01490 [Amphibacillus sp. Q70]|uniref:hypothetical protein n=1 Tax=Amphibacillus sp. Q70 TaxID=3453416 RepID=UPI003F8607DD
MKNKAKEYREATNKIEQQFNEENKEYFEELRSYFLFSSLLYDETSMNEQIFSIAQDLLEAQENGESALNFFGHQPKAMADEIVQQLKPSSWKERLQLIGIIVGITWLTSFMTDFSSHGPVTINSLKYLLLTLLTTLMVGGTFKLMKMSSFKKKTKANKVKEFLGIWLFFLVYIGLGILIFMFTPNVMSFVIPYPTDLIIIGSVSLLGLIAILVQKEPTFYPFSLMIIGFGCAGIFVRYWRGNHFPVDTILVVVSLSIIFTGFIGYTIWMSLQLRKEKNKTTSS